MVKKSSMFEISGQFITDASKNRYSAAGTFPLAHVHNRPGCVVVKVFRQGLWQVS